MAPLVPSPRQMAADLTHTKTKSPTLAVARFVAAWLALSIGVGVVTYVFWRLEHHGLPGVAGVPGVAGGYGVSACACIVGIGMGLPDD